jgi:hypothetical protein
LSKFAINLCVVVLFRKESAFGVTFDFLVALIDLTNAYVSHHLKPGALVAMR